jgi:hypothetical protein
MLRSCDVVFIHKVTLRTGSYVDLAPPGPEAMRPLDPWWYSLDESGWEGCLTMNMMKHVDASHQNTRRKMKHGM